MVMPSALKSALPEMKFSVSPYLSWYVPLTPPQAARATVAKGTVSVSLFCSLCCVLFLCIYVMKKLIRQLQCPRQQEIVAFHLLLQIFWLVSAPLVSS